MIAALAAEPSGVSPERIVELVRLSPMERVAIVSEKLGDDELLRAIESQYEWFIAQTGRPKDQALAWIADSAARDDAFRRAREFGSAIYDLLVQASGETEQMRYLVI
jgi:hypothetical protein